MWLAFQTFRPVSLDDALFADHLVSFLKLVEYALLAVAVPLLVRRASDLAIVIGGVVLWAPSQSGVALLQFFGVDIFDAWNAGWRQPSFLGHHDLAALSAISLALAAAAIVARRRRHRCRRSSSSRSSPGSLGLDPRRLGRRGRRARARRRSRSGSRPARRFRPGGRQTLALVAIVAVVAGGVTAVRGDALEDFLRFLGVRGDEPPIGVESYSQRTVLAYIGLRIAQDNPIVGVGWQRSSRPEVFEPYVDDARARFPDVVDLAFPAEGREWGVQNLYIQMLADAGVIGLALLLARRRGGSPARVARGDASPHTLGRRRRPRRRLRAPHARGGVGVARHRRRNPAAGRDVPPARARGSRRGSAVGSEMADPRLDPPRSMPTYAVRAPLVRWLREQSDEAYRRDRRYRVLDVGCGAKPYEPVFSAHAASYVGVDPVDNPRAELKAPSKTFPSTTRASTSCSATRCSSTATTP